MPKSNSKNLSKYPKVPLFNAIEIIPGLWLGDKNDANSYFFLKEKSIKIIINCTTDVSFIVGELKIEKKRLSIEDCISYYKDNEKMYNSFDNITSYIYKCLNNNENVLVHSVLGKQRAPTIISAYLIRYARVTKEQSIKYIRSKSPGAFRPKDNFNISLEKWAHDMKKKYS